MRRVPIPLIIATILVLPVVDGAPIANLTAAPQSASALPGVPVTEEQHHHLVLENPYVKVFEVEVGPHDATLMHQHLYDYTYIVFGDADLTNAVAGKPEAKLKLPNLTVNFSRGPFAHIAANNGDTAFRNITIELLHPQGEMKKYYPTISEALAAGTPDAKGVRQVGVLETDEMRVVAAGLAGGSVWSPAHDGRDRLVVIMDKILDASGPKEKNSPFPAGMLTWVAAGKNWSLANKSAQEMKLLVVEFKDSAAKRSSLTEQ
jgi:hypothetical protein